MTDTTALARRDSDPVAILPRTFAETREMSEYLANSAIVPENARKQPHNLFAMVAAGAELGLAPMAALRSFHSIKGLPKLTADALVAVCLARPDICEYFTPVELNADRATWETKRKAAPQPVRISWDIKRAIAAKKLNEKGEGIGDNSHNWTAYRQNMLSARAKAELARTVYPDITLGMGTVEESDDEPIASAGGVEVFARPPVTPPAEQPKARAARKVEPPAPPSPPNDPPPPASVTPPAAASPVNPPSAPPPAPAPPSPPNDPPPPASVTPPAAASPVNPPSAPPPAPVTPPPAPIADAEIVEPAPADEGFGDLAEPATMTRFRAALDKAATLDDLKVVRAEFVPWSNSAEGKPFAEAMRDAFGAKQAEIKAKAAAPS